MGLLAQGAAVRVTGRRFMGRSRFLRELGAELERIGYSVITVRGRAIYSTLAFGAVRSLLSTQTATHPHPSTVTDELAHLFQAERRTVVLIDDDIDVDEPSLAAIAEAAERTGTAIVATSLPFSQQSGDQRRRGSICQFGALVELPVLGYDDVSALAHELLGGTVSALIIIRAAAKSSGVTGLAAHILTTARMSGAIVSDHGRWVMAEESLWNQHLLPVVERYFDDLGEAEFRTLYELSLLGGCIIDDFTPENPDVLGRLDAGGLLTMFTGSGDRTAISVTPTILIDYFRNRPVDTVTVGVLHRISATGLPLPDVPELVQLTAEPGGSRIDDFSFARLMRDRRQEHLETSRSAWSRDPNPTTIIGYLTELVRSRADDEEVHGLLQHLDLDDFTEDQLLLLGSFASMWCGEITSAEPLIARIRERAPNLDGAFTAMAMRANFNREGMSDEVRTWLRDADAEPTGIARAIAYYVRSVCGESSEVPAAARTGVPMLVDPLYFIGDSLNALREGRARETLERALTLRDEDRARFDKDLMAVRSYIAMLVLLRTGEWDRARALIASTLALGAPSKYFTTIYVALMRFSVLLHARRSDRDIASSLMADLAFYGPVDGVLPGMQADFETLLSSYLAAGDVAGRPQIAALAQSSADHGIYASAIIIALLGISLSFTSEGVDLLRELTVDRGDHRHDTLLDLADAVLTQDPHLEDQIDDVLASADRFAMMRILLQARARGLDAGPLSASFARVVDRMIHAIRPTLSETADLSLISPEVQHDALTLREREIALLAISLSNVEISQRLGLSVRTVENHVARAMKKLGATSRAAFQSLL